ncbi:MAG: VOC family protein [Acidimicrobiales bacterium]|jgi:hypothetical protein
MSDRLVQAIVLVSDLGAARSRMEALGFTVLDGGRHPGRGTANLIIPFGRHYLELLAVVDHDEALASPQGRPIVTALSGRGPGLARWSVEPVDIERTAGRLGLPTERRSRVLPSGETVRWRSVGVDTAWLEPWRCAFMAWDDPRLHPARGAVTHPNGATGFARLDVVAPDHGALVAWLGGTVPESVHLSAAAGAAGPVALLLSSPAGEIPLTTTGP